MAAAFSIILFWTIIFGALATRDVSTRREELVEGRLGRLVKGEIQTDPDILLGRKESPSLRRLRLRLQSLGLNRHRDLQRALLLRRISYLAPLLCMGALFFMGFPMPQVLAWGGVFALIFILIPKILILRSHFKRKREIERNLPDTLDLLTLCLEAGLSFDASLVRVAAEQERVSSHISRELRLTNQEILAGLSRKAALNNLADRTNVEEVRTLVGAIQQSIKLGTSLVKTLRTQAQVTRKKKREQIRAAIMKTPVKLIFPLMFLIFPTLLIVILAPSMINIFRNFSSVGY